MACSSFPSFAAAAARFPPVGCSDLATLAPRAASCRQLCALAKVGAAALFASVVVARALVVVAAVEVEDAAFLPPPHPAVTTTTPKTKTDNSPSFIAGYHLRSIL